MDCLDALVQDTRDLNRKPFWLILTNVYCRRPALELIQTRHPHLRVIKFR